MYQCIQEMSMNSIKSIGSKILQRADHATLCQIVCMKCISFLLRFTLFHLEFPESTNFKVTSGSPSPAAPDALCGRQTCKHRKILKFPDLALWRNRYSGLRRGSNIVLFVFFGFARRSSGLRRGFRWAAPEGRRAGHCVTRIESAGFSG